MREGTPSARKLIVGQASCLTDDPNDHSLELVGMFVIRDTLVPPCPLFRCERCGVVARCNMYDYSVIFWREWRFQEQDRDVYWHPKEE